MYILICFVLSLSKCAYCCPLFPLQVPGLLCREHGGRVRIRRDRAPSAVLRPGTTHHRAALPAAHAHFAGVRALPVRGLGGQRRATAQCVESDCCVVWVASSC